MKTGAGRGGDETWRIHVVDIQNEDGYGTFVVDDKVLKTGL
jgi:hypothetical protein